MALRPTCLQDREIAVSRGVAQLLERVCPLAWRSPFPGGGGGGGSITTTRSMNNLMLKWDSRANKSRNSLWIIGLFIRIPLYDTEAKFVWCMSLDFQSLQSIDNLVI
jgi:hypothetical protein